MISTLRHLLAHLCTWIAVTASAPAITVLVEAEQLELPGAWELSLNPRSETARGYLTAGEHARHAPAAGAIDLPRAGKWRLWVRSKDFPADRPGTRLFTVRLGTQTAAVKFGKHGHGEFEGWAWEDGGVFELPAGPLLIAIGDDAAHSARCDALVLTDNMGYVPEGVPWKLQKPAAVKVPLTITEESKRGWKAESLTSLEEKPIATLENSALRLSFHPGKAASGDVIGLRATAGDLSLNDAAAESYRVLYRPRESDPKIVSTRVNPTWDLAYAPEVEARCGEATVRTRLGIATAPWASARCFSLRPTGVHRIDAQTVELGFPPTEAGELSATWRLVEGKPRAQVELRFTPSKPGHYSLGYHGLLATPQNEADFVLLPFMYQGRRMPEQPAMLLSALTPTPLALVNRGGLSCALVAEPGELSLEWPGPKNSRYALGLRNEDGLAQPLIYSPVLGQPGSLSEGAMITARFEVLIERGNWYGAYQRAVDEVFAVTDYRRPTNASLYDAALNLYELMRDEKAAGWNARAKAPWNIERPNLVTQSAPLTYLSYYLLTGDEDFYRRFAQPSLEYLVSRPSAHFGTEQEVGEGYYTHQPMRGPGELYGATTYAAAYAMTHGRSAVFGEYCLDEKGEARRTRPHGHTQPFEDELALYRLTGERRWLDAARAGADEYISKNITTLPTRDLGVVPFVNIGFVPDWEGLLHLYESTHERRYLEASAEGARWLLTSLWTQPAPTGERTINPGGEYDHARYIWWWGDHRYRRGIYDGPGTWENVDTPAPRLPEHRVPAWLVSTVGLGLEQPSTYTRGRFHANILMSNWSANLLRLAPLTGDEAFRVAARNATIGRSASYPGYYLDGFSDEYQRADYPITGPDITSIYVHHIPVHAAWILDYLFTDAELRSQGAVAFPWVRQNGYAWFDHRLFGHAPGTVYGQKAWPWLHRTAATVDNVAVDRVLAEGDGKFHVVLLNQTHEAQRVRVSFDPKALGRSLDGAAVKVNCGNQPAPELALTDGAAELELAPMEIAALTLEGVHIDVPTHRVAASEKLSLPSAPARQRVLIAGTALEAVATVIAAPPFETTDFYVHVTAALGELRAARLRYRVGDGQERQLDAGEFPFEFSVPMEGRVPVSWQVELELPDGRWIQSDWKNFESR